MVIVILGILSAVALPKFVDLGGDARVAAMKSAEGSMRAANSIIYAKAAAGNSMSGTTAAPVNVLINGINIPTVYGYAANVAALVNVMDLSPDFDRTSVANVISHNGAKTEATCRVLYAPASTATGVTSSPRYTLTTTGC
jgi:MSHA pilin protein MshA